MTFWWMEPGWKSACCCQCGANIWDTGGDPDWGYCFPCFEQHQQEQHDACQQSGPVCEICKNGWACASVNGYDVCSEACADEAESRVIVGPDTNQTSEPS